VSVTMSFSDIDDLVGGLPPSHVKRQWWANPASGASAQYVAWIGAERVVEAVDFESATVRFSPRGVKPKAKGASSSVIDDGVAALEALIRRAGYESTLQLVAAHATFLHPTTVAQTNGSALFPIVRSMTKRGTFSEASGAKAHPSGRSVYFDDNRTPTDAFLWAAERRRGPDIQYNHIWSYSDDPDAYTALWNLCATPPLFSGDPSSSTGSCRKGRLSRLPPRSTAL
jgi:hypothetical protein